MQSSILEQSEFEQEEEPTYNALDFCSQNPYPGDDQQLLMEREILNIKYGISDKLLKSSNKINQAEAAKQLKVRKAVSDVPRNFSFSSVYRVLF